MEIGIHKREMHNPFRAREASGRNGPRQKGGGPAVFNHVMYVGHLIWTSNYTASGLRLSLTASAYTSQIMLHLNLDTLNNVSLM